MNNTLTGRPREQQYLAEINSAGVVKNLNVHVFLKLAAVWKQKMARKKSKFSRKLCSWLLGRVKVSLTLRGIPLTNGVGTLPVSI